MRHNASRKSARPLGLPFKVRDQPLFVLANRTMHFADPRGPSSHDDCANVSSKVRSFADSGRTVVCIWVTASVMRSRVGFTSNHRHLFVAGFDRVDLGSRFKFWIVVPHRQLGPDRMLVVDAGPDFDVTGDDLVAGDLAAGQNLGVVLYPGETCVAEAARAVDVATGRLP